MRLHQSSLRIPPLGRRVDVHHISAGRSSTAASLYPIYTSKLDSLPTTIPGQLQYVNILFDILELSNPAGYNDEVCDCCASQEGAQRRAGACEILSTATRLCRIPWPNVNGGLRRGERRFHR